jgi:hypothetical protein
MKDERTDLSALVRGFHRALHVACGLPALSPSPGDQHAWWDFLREMSPLDDPEAGGPLTAVDIQDVLGEMKRANKAGQAQWSLRPSKILRDPEAFRDLVLIARKKRNARPIQPATRLVEQHTAGFRRQVEVPNESKPASTADLLNILHAHKNP